MTLKYPFVTEKAMVLLENQSKLQFLVTREANKDDIKRDIEKAFGQNVKSVRTLMNTHGQKKAIVSFENDKAAEEILSARHNVGGEHGTSNHNTKPGQGRPDIPRSIPPVQGKLSTSVMTRRRSPERLSTSNTIPHAMHRSRSSNLRSNT